jgi:S-methylmethionine-dependent homocysteine/selenocysteine methylase
MSIEDGLTYRHKAYANSMKAYRQANPDWKEQQLASEEYAKKWMETSARVYQIAQEKLAKLNLEAL